MFLSFFSPFLRYTFGWWQCRVFFMDVIVLFSALTTRWCWGVLILGGVQCVFVFCLTEDEQTFSLLQVHTVSGPCDTFTSLICNKEHGDRNMHLWLLFRTNLAKIIATCEGEIILLLPMLSEGFLRSIELWDYGGKKEKKERGRGAKSRTCGITCVAAEAEECHVSGVRSGSLGRMHCEDCNHQLSQLS